VCNDKIQELTGTAALGHSFARKTEANGTIAEPVYNDTAGTYTYTYVCTRDKCETQVTFVIKLPDVTDKTANFTNEKKNYSGTGADDVYNRAFTVTYVKSTCQAVGYISYTTTFDLSKVGGVAGAKDTVTIKINQEAVDHKAAANDKVEYTVFVDGSLYKGFLCEACGQIIFNEVYTVKTNGATTSQVSKDNVYYTWTETDKDGKTVTKYGYIIEETGTSDGNAVTGELVVLAEKPVKGDEEDAEEPEIREVPGIYKPEEKAAEDED
jgi:hypothetical protein